MINNNEKIKQLINDGWKYEICGLKYTIIETYRDKWVYIIRDSDDYEHIEKIEYVISQWDEKEEERLDLEHAIKGQSNITKYFKKYGVLYKNYETNKNSKYFCSIIYDGEHMLDPRYIWNSEMYIKSINIHYSDINNSINKYGFVNKFELSFLKHNISIDATIGEDDIPKIRDSHNHYNNIHNEYKTHYTNIEWNLDIKKAIDIYMYDINILFDEEEEIFHSRNLYYQKTKNYIIKVDDSIYQMEFLDGDKQKYRNVDCGISKLPKFKSTITKKELMDSIRNDITKNIENNQFDSKFKY